MEDKDWQAEIVRIKRRERKAKALLGVSEQADNKEIRQAYRRASLEHHPDANQGDEGAADRFHLICCAYKFLTEGEPCPELDEVETQLPEHTDGKYKLDNPWGYWCWWRDKFFGDAT
jgi:DnaJ-class molecular chaperone